MTSAANPDVNYDHMPSALRFAMRQMLKGVNTCLPGEVVTYDPGKRTASVRPSVTLLTTDGETVDRPVVPDVPVLFPQGGGFSLSYQLVPGDSVLLVYSQRGISGWKLGYQKAPPDPESLFSERDALAIPGFSPAGAQPANSIDVGSNGIVIKSATRVSIEAPTVEVNGRDIS